MPPGIRASPPKRVVKAVTFGAPREGVSPEFRTYTRPFRAATLTGATPTEGTLPISLRPLRVT